MDYVLKSPQEKKRGQFVNNGWKELRSVTKLDWHLNYGNETTLNIPPFWSVKSIHLLKSTSRSPYTSWIVFIEWGKWLPKWRYLKIKLKRTNVFIWSINGRFFSQKNEEVCSFVLKKNCLCMVNVQYARVCMNSWVLHNMKDSRLSKK